MSNDPSSDATRQLIQGMLTRLEQSGVEMQGLALDDLADAMSHPLAARTVEELMGREASSAQKGDPAPDFELPRLDGSGSVRLSDHFGKRPVALVFGSYT